MINKIKNHKITRVTHKILRIKLTILVLAILPFVVFTLLTSKTDLVNGMKSFVVLTGSMDPAIPVGSVVYVQDSPVYTNGDVISFTSTKDQTITHRISQVVTENNVTMYKTKGDANNAVDTELVTKDRIIGKTVFQVPYVGYVINYLRTPQGFVALIIVPTFLFIGYELWSIKREIEKETEKRVLKKLQSQPTST